MNDAYQDPELIRQIHECRPLIRIDLRLNKGHARIANMQRMTDDLRKQELDRKWRTLYRQAFTYRFG